MLGELENTFEDSIPGFVATYKRLEEARNHQPPIETSKAGASRIMLTVHQQDDSRNKSSPNSPNTSFSSRSGSLQAHLRSRGSVKHIKLSNSANKKKVYVKSKFNNKQEEDQPQEKKPKEEVSYQKVDPIE